MKDVDGNEVAVGDSVQVLSFDEASLAELPEAERQAYRSLLGTTEQIDEITEDGYATLGKWVEDAGGQFTFIGIALQPHQFRLVSRRAWR